MGTCKAPHVVVFAFPAQGHVNGAMDLSRKLALLGVSISFVCTEAYITSMIKQGFDAGGLPIRLHGLVDGLPQEKSMMDSLDQVDALIKVTEGMDLALEDLLNKLNDEDFGVASIIYDSNLWWVGRVGKEFQISAYIFNPMSASFFSYLLHIPDFVAQGRLPLGPHTDLSDTSNMFKIPGFPSLHVSEVPDISWDPNPVCSFNFVLRCATRWRDATGMLLNTVYELEEEVIEGLRAQAPGMDIKAIGPILPSTFLSKDMSKNVDVESADVLKWLDEQPPASVLYIAFGTIACLSEAQLHQLAVGLEASKQRFVWVLRTPEQHRGSRKLEEGVVPISGFEERTKGTGVVLRRLAPQREILVHRSIGGFLTHCGWNSTMESLCSGVPMVCYPMFADQNMNGKWVAETLQTGKLLKRGEDGIVSKEEVERQVGEVMSLAGTPTSSLRLSASRLKDVASYAALDPDGSSYKNLHAFVEALHK